MAARAMLIACTLLLASCSHMHGHREAARAGGASGWVDSGLARIDAARCTGAQCTIAVRAGDCSPTASPHYLVLTRRNTVVRWEVQDKGYTFAERDGIAFKRTAGPDPATEFRSCGRVNPTTWQCVGTGTHEREAFWYGIKLIGPGGKACEADPIIVNDM